MRPGVIERYRRRLPVSDRTPVVTLGEGDTPLIRARAVERAVGLDIEVYLKFEGANPTASFKDRGMTVAVSKALEEGARAVVCASTGNTSASAAAYAAHAGVTAVVVLPEGNVALGKLSQALLCGARVVPIRGNFDQALTLARDLAERYPVTLVNSLNPYRIEGQKTGAFEIVDALGRAPTWQFMPVGNAGNITAYPIVHGRVVEKPETLATAIRIGNPASWRRAEAARDESGGVIDLVSDEEILKAYRLLAAQVGVFAEPASAAGVAGLLRYAAEGRLSPPEGEAHPTVVCILTGHGLKDPERAVATVRKPGAVPATLEAVVREAGL